MTFRDEFAMRRDECEAFAGTTHPTQSRARLALRRGGKGLSTQEPTSRVCARGTHRNVAVYQVGATTAELKCVRQSMRELLFLTLLTLPKGLKANDGAAWRGKGCSDSGNQPISRGMHGR